MCSVHEGAREDGKGQFASCWHSGRMRLDDRCDGACGIGDSFVHVGDIDKRGKRRSRRVSDVVEESVRFGKNDTFNARDECTRNNRSICNTYLGIRQGCMLSFF